MDLAATVPAESQYNEYDPTGVADPASKDMDELLSEWQESDVTVYIDVKGVEGKSDKRYVVTSPGYLHKDLSRAVIQFSNHVRAEILPETTRSRSPIRKPWWVKPREFPSDGESVFYDYVMSNPHPVEGEPWFYLCCTCSKTYRSTAPEVTSRPSLS